MNATATTTRKTRTRKPPAELYETDPHAQRAAALRLRDEVQAEAARLTAAVAASPDALSGLFANARALVTRHWPGAESAKLVIQLPPAPGTIPVGLNYIHVPLTAPEPISVTAPADPQAARERFASWLASVLELVDDAAGEMVEHPEKFGLTSDEAEAVSGELGKARDNLLLAQPGHLHPDARNLPAAPWR